MAICGIDPGINGGIVIIDDKDNIIYASNLPVVKDKSKKRQLDLFQIKKILMDYRPEVIVIEDVHAYPKQGTVSTFNFGKAFGLLIGLCYGLNIPVFTVSCKTWQKQFQLSGDKKSIITQAQLINPNTKFTEHTASAYFIAKWYSEIRWKK